MIGDGERLLVVVAKIGEARELVCDRVREGERAPRRQQAWGVHEAVSRCTVVIVYDDVGRFFDSCSSSSRGGSLLRDGKKHKSRAWRLGLLKWCADQRSCLFVYILLPPNQIIRSFNRPYLQGTFPSDPLYSTVFQFQEYLCLCPGFTPLEWLGAATSVLTPRLYIIPRHHWPTP